MVLSISKSKPIVACTRKLRRARAVSEDLHIMVCTQQIKATQSEKLLGMVLNRDLTWSTHLWGETWRDKDNWPGLVSQLANRVGILRHLAKILHNKALKNLASGLFRSKLLFCLPEM